MTFDLLREWIGGGMTVVGALFMVISALGLLRMPDIFTRLHASSVADTAGAGFIFVGLLVLEGFTLVGARLVFLLMAFALMGPVATHAVARAALHAGVKPLVEDDSTTATAEETRPEDRP